MKLSILNEKNQKSFEFETGVFAKESALTDAYLPEVSNNKNHYAYLPLSTHLKTNLVAHLKTLSNDTLDADFKSLLKKERKVLAIVIIYTAEVERRKMYLSMGYQSLFDFMTKHYGYSNGPAQRRIDAARLSLDLPGIISDIESGELNLSQVEVLQRGLREMNHKITKEEKFELVAALKNKSVTETQISVAKALNITLKEKPQVTHQKDESVRFEVTLSKAQWEKLQSLRELLSNAIPDGAWDKVLEYVSNEKIEELTKPHPKNKQVSLKQAILERDQCCQYKDKTTGKLCGSKWSLEIDHIRPKWAGGDDAPENLRVLCGNHNRHVYREQANIRRI